MESFHHNAMRHVATGCACCGVSRRKFLAGCAACAAGAAGLSTFATARASAADDAGKARIRLVFGHRPADAPTWPHAGYDHQRRAREVTERLTKACPNVQFLPTTVQSSAEVEKLLRDGEPIDGYLVYLTGSGTRAGPLITASGRPTLLATDLYGGTNEFLHAVDAAVRAKNPRVAAVSSSRLDDVVEAARCFELLKKPGGTAESFVAACNAARRKGMKPAGDAASTPDPVQCRDIGQCLEKLRGSTMLVVGRDPGAQGKAIEANHGTKVLPIAFGELQDAYLKADRDQAAQWADRWAASAEKVMEPTIEELHRSAAMYLAQLELLKRHNAQVISINCLDGFYGGHIQAYPCLAFSQLNNDGLVGGCEADILSAFTMLAMGYLTGRPGFISDPVIDTATYQLVYAHCVAPTKVFGPGGTVNAYRIRTHSEDRKGAAMQSLLPTGYLLTTMKINPAKREALLHQAKAVGNVDDERACRTKLAAELHGDIEKLMNHWFCWDESWHRVTFYGDLKEPVKQLSEAMGLTLVEEA